MQMIHRLGTTRALTMVALVPMLLLSFMVAGSAHAASQGPSQRILHVVVTDNITGAPVAGAKISISTPASPMVTGLTDKDGVFQTMLSEGSYRMDIAAPNYKPVSKIVQIVPSPSPVTYVGVVLQSLVVGPVPTPGPNPCIGCGSR